jgi:hypothetical protein
MKVHVLCLVLMLVGSSCSVIAVGSPYGGLSALASRDAVDIPTWYPGDSWMYRIDPLMFSDVNGSFEGTVADCQLTVESVEADQYTLSVYAAIDGQFTGSGMTGDVSGTIMGTSLMRRSDLAQCSTNLTSSGFVTVIFIPVPYTAVLNFFSTPSLEAFDFPLAVGDVWQIQTESITHGWFEISSVVNQSLDGSQVVDETVTCPQHADVTIPAGTFDCYEITRESSDAWYSGQVGNLVKSTIDQSDGTTTIHAVLTLQSYTHVDQPITVTEDLQPASVYPGDTINITGHCQDTSSDTPLVDAAVIIEIPSTGDLWTTTTDANGDYTKTIIAPTLTDDTPRVHETGSGGVVATCQKNNLTGYRVATLTTLYNSPPQSPTITGPAKGKPNVPYTFNLTTTDPEDDAVYYFVDWGDDTNSSWVGPSASGAVYQLTHSFEKKGTFTVQAKAKDALGMESDWSTLEVKMPAVFSSMHGWFFERFPHAFPILRWLFQQF